MRGATISPLHFASSRRSELRGWLAWSSNAAEDGIGCLTRKKLLGTCAMPRYRIGTRRTCLTAYHGSTTVRHCQTKQKQGHGQSELSRVPLLAQIGHYAGIGQYPLSGVNQT